MYDIAPLCIHIAIESNPGDQSELPNLDTRKLPQLLALIATVVQIHDFDLVVQNGSSRPLYAYNRGRLSSEQFMGARSTSLVSFSRIAWRNSADLELMSRVISGLVDATSRSASLLASSDIGRRHLPTCANYFLTIQRRALGSPSCSTSSPILLWSTTTRKHSAMPRVTSPRGAA